ncbi:MAG: hypothetical protein AABW80_00725 [Nanoarchaeota archaeon]
MSLDNVGEYLPQVSYVIGSLSVGIGLVAGYFIGRATANRNGKEFILTGKDKVELVKLEHAETERAHQRRLQLDEIAFQRKKTTDELRSSERLGIARELASLAPTIESYLTRLVDYQTNPPAIDPAVAEKRREYREELVDEFKEKTEENYGTIETDDFEVEQEHADKIDRLVNMKFPFSQIPEPIMPAPLRRLVDYLFEADKEEEEN